MKEIFDARNLLLNFIHSANMPSAVNYKLQWSSDIIEKVPLHGKQKII